MSVQPAAVELLTSLAPVLDRWGRWLVFGAQAVVIHGVPRLSADVDVTLALTPDVPDRFAAEMRAAGFVLRVEAGRPKDIEDVRALWGLHVQSLDADRIRAVLRLLQEALDRSDLLPAFESIARGGPGA